MFRHLHRWKDIVRERVKVKKVVRKTGKDIETLSQWDRERQKDRQREIKRERQRDRETGRRQKDKQR